VVSGAGFIGGHLAYRKGVGVDQTVFRGRVEDWTPVLKERELPEAKARRVRAGGTDILLYRSQGGIFALANRCSHRGGPLHKGRVADRTLRCPWHLSTFSLEDGSILQGPRPRRSPATTPACGTAPSRCASPADRARSGPSTHDARCPTLVELCWRAGGDGYAGSCRRDMS
jgi:nitrite reductase/ring-hydroxylating ferredoxin subunit